MTIEVHDDFEDVDIWRNPDHKSKCCFYCALLDFAEVDEQTTVKRFVKAAKTKADELTGEDCHGGAWAWRITDSKDVVVNIYKNSWSRGAEFGQIFGALYVGLIFYDAVDINIPSEIGGALIKEFPCAKLINTTKYEVPTEIVSYNLDVYYKPEKQ